MTTKEADEASARADKARSEVWSITLLKELAACPHILTDEGLVAALEAATSIVMTERAKVVGPIRAELMTRLKRQK